MSEDLNALILRRIGQPMSPGEDAVVAVLKKCEQLRTLRVGPDNEPVGRDIAAEFEQTIARALGITH